MSLAVLGCACASEDNDAVQFLTGRVDGTETLIGVVVTGDRSIGYLCDGAEGTVNVSEWFEGTADAQSVHLQSAGGTVIDGMRTAAGLSGTLSTGESYSTQRSHDAVSGIYVGVGEVDGGAVVGGWVVHEPAQQRGRVSFIQEFENNKVVDNLDGTGELLSTDPLSFDAASDPTDFQITTSTGSVAIVETLKLTSERFTQTADE